MKESNIIIFGPTASGKTSLSIKLAREINGEIINMDSLQVYKELDIGTAKPSKSEMGDIKHHLFNFLEPDEEITVQDYKMLAESKIKEIDNSILVGGTGLYLSSIYYNFKFRKKTQNKDYYNSILNEKGIKHLQNMLYEKSKEIYNSIDINNSHRLIRALESNINIKSNKTINDKYFIVNIEIERDILRNRVVERLNMMLKNGFLEEVDLLYSKYKKTKSLSSIGYKEAIMYINGSLRLEEMKQLIITNTMRYAKRQRTWIRNQYKKKFNLDYNLNIDEKISLIKKELGEKFV